MKSEQFDSLSAEKIQFFHASLSGLSQDEVRKAKVLYLRNAISEYEAMNEGLKAFGCVQLVFMIIPIFWPILYVQRRMMNTGKKLMRDKITNAIDVWKDDLDGETFQIPE